MNAVFVTGATGFIGRVLTTQLLANGCAVAAAVRLRAGVLNLPPAVRQIGFDLEAPGELEPDELAGISCLFHLAAHVHVMGQTPTDAARFELLNVRATEHLARVAARAGVRRFVFVSSIKVNGERTSGRPFTAADEPNPVDAYGESKLKAEQALWRVATATGLEAVVVRPPLVYGPRVGANFRRLLSLARSRLPLPLAAVDNRRSLVSVWNLVDLLVQVGRDHRAAGRIWLVSDGEDVSTPHLLQAIGRAMGSRVHLWSVPVSWLRAFGTALGRSGEISRLVDSLQVDVGATCSELGWRPSLTFRDGIARTVAWFMESRRGVA